MLQAFSSFSRQVRAERETTEARVSTFVIVRASLQNGVERPQVCDAGLDLVLAPTLGHMADVWKATLPAVNARKKVCEAQPYLRTHPAAPEDPTVLGPRLLGAWYMGTGGQPYTCADLKDFVGEAPPFLSGI